ncbi:hypothetical protein Poli38472_012316 [Pythium oligandrum]|uniref:phospholipase D n=1 Tax=Pythium oligandrum TaxID=41045 RepID=A0A8K1FKK1_PYTOL|nr:hypothetical protein Poli38472_012316 [Pythium oligandrum]|eukprot:TMW67200.1 hypothetical protein Poli38472_012316 [Pythium oligandrum]
MQLARVVSFLSCVLWTLAPEAQAARAGITCQKRDNPIKIVAQLCMCEPCHVCEYSLTKKSCGLIKDNGMVLSDGSENQPVQPTLDAEQWFLTEDEITQSRGGVPRSDMQVYSTGNKVHVFPAADTLFLSVYDDIERSNANDTIYLAAWSTDDITFDPINDPTGERTSFKDIMGRAINRGADFRALVWRNMLEKKQNVKLRDIINSLPKPTEGGSTRFIFDDRMPELASSLHQKTLVLRQQNKLIAYIGGIDLTSDRWDTVRHNESEFRKKLNIRRNHEGWIDGHYRIEGPAALDVGANFLARWNSDFKPMDTIVSDVIREFKNPEYAKLPDYTSKGPLDLTSDGKQAVQITRTFSCKYPHYKEFAPKGEKSILQARIKAIKMAKNYIYIEDQYFILVPELLEALLEVLPRIQRLIVVAQRVPDGMKPTGYEKYFYDMVAPIQSRYPNKFQLYSTKEALNVYIHSKIVIIDDVYVSQGSANWNRRSMTSDAEIGANVVDTDLVTSPEGLQVGKVVRDFRVAKFAEMLGKSVDEVAPMPLLEVADLYDTVAADPSSLIERLDIHEHSSYAAFNDVVRQKVDPDDKC